MGQPEESDRRSPVTTSDSTMSEEGEVARPEAKPDSAESGVQAVVLEQYKLAAEMADRVSARRTTANSFFATIHTALLAVVGAVFVADVDTSGADSGQTAAAIGIGLVGLILAGAWFLLLRSYRDLNRAKFKVIQDLEKELPTAPFANEWKYLKDDPVKGWRERYAEQGSVERLVPFAFGALYIAAAIWVMAT